MATVNTGEEVVMVIRIHRRVKDGIWISSVTREDRSVYENSKGRFIKTVSEGQIFLDEFDRAVIADAAGVNNRGWSVPVKWTPTTLEIELALRDLFKEFGLGGFVK